MHSKLFSVIKILGLSIGLTVCMLIFLFTKDEISYDQFHDNKDQLYRVIQNWQFGSDPPRVIGGTNAIVAESFANEIPEVQDYVRVKGDDITVKKGDEVFNENPLFVDSNFFSIFTFPLIDGDPATALNDLHDVVISKELAQKYFGTTDVIGQTLELKVGDEWDIFTVTALVRLAGNPRVVSVAARNRGRNLTSVKVEGKIIEIENTKIDENFFSTFRIPVISGRNFSPEHPSDATHSVIVNESFVREAGWKLSEAVGKTVNFMNNDNRQPATVIGIIRDYHFVSLKEKVTPALFSMYPAFSFGQIWIRISPEDVPGTLSSLERSYRKLVTHFPYIYEFMDEINARNYVAESKLKEIIGIASMLFILISCMGLLGLVMLSIDQRIKEIGVRRVLGAGVSGIVTLISKEFAIVICIAIVVAIPAGYFVLDTWLQEFAYRINLHSWMFALAGALVMALALLIVCLQAVKAALSNPVRNLRSE